MEVSDINFIEQQLKAQFDVQKEVYEKQIEDLKALIDCFKNNTPLEQQALILNYKNYKKQVEEDRKVILIYDKDLRRANTKLDRIQEAINCDDYHKEHCIYCSEAHHCYTKQVLEIIGE